ncbi:pyridoxal phosphate-dependent decarboxylase family protein [Kordiimonas marina]|uniref:pyridoxal phosphate-dependent decarboxylase family protein n=1 Tax=Kordiimonas marina TaxID=2872312 RepID=UPI001FF16867|nr:aminotransferase class V-fold PLP-dependent enzyme [Kordiimonas marina]MCJ9427493.1 aminotransferase class V-fold PLP-dependent enzyme [Kordiimonas marina]
MTDPRYAPLLDLAAAHAADYIEGLPDMPVFPGVAARAGLSAFDEALPEVGIDPRYVIDRLHGAGSPATVANAGGRYYGFVIGGALPVTVAANWLAGAWDQVVTSSVNSPAGTYIEDVACRWLLDFLDLPRESAVGLTTGATVASFTALAAARSALLARAGWDVEADGLYGAPEIKVVVSDDVHATIEKDLAMLGLGRNRVTRVPVDSEGRMRADALPPLDALTLVCTQCGNVNSGSIDPIGAIVREARKVGAWVHVDGAVGLWALALDDLAETTEGIVLADSWVTDGHKGLNTPYDCGIVIVKEAAALHRAMGISAAYLPEAMGEPKDRVPESSRRARGVEVWAAMASLGRQGLIDMFNRFRIHARAFAAGLEDIGFEVLNDVMLNQVVATIGTPEELKAIRAHVEASGECWFGPTHWLGRDAIRIAISSWRTTEADVDRSLAAIRAAKEAVIG